MKTKQVNYAYPSSIMANKYNMPDGCWTVEVGNGSYTPWPKAIKSVHKTERSAINTAYAILLPWSRCWMDCAKRNRS